MRALACALAFALAAYLALGAIAVASPASSPPRLELRAAGLDQAGRVDLYARWHSVCGGPRHLLYRFHVGT